MMRRIDQILNHKKSQNVSSSPCFSFHGYHVKESLLRERRKKIFSPVRVHATFGMKRRVEREVGNFGWW